MPTLCSNCGLDYATPGMGSCEACRDRARSRIRRNTWARANRTRWSALSVESKAHANARRAANRAQAYGELIPQPCERCGDPKAQKHHPDYKQPLMVLWLCQLCHRWEHAGETA